MINGRKTEKVNVNCLFRQGCPLSSLLFAAYLEPLCRIILAGGNIRDLQLPDRNLKLLAYADDVTIIMSDEEQILTALERLEDFCAVSGEKLNKKKTTGTWLGNWACKPVEVLGLK